MNLPEKLGLIFLVSEIGVSVLRRSGTKSTRHDGGSLALLWVTISAAMVGAVLVASLLPQFAFVLKHSTAKLVGPVFVLGLVLRWWAIISLGKFFTVDVAIATDHQLIVRGPYHFVRHPSYTGMMVAFFALALTFQNWLSFACVLVPISLALTYRIYVEEIALEATFGESYQQYARRLSGSFPESSKSVRRGEFRQDAERDGPSHL